MNKFTGEKNQEKGKTFYCGSNFYTVKIVKLSVFLLLNKRLFIILLIKSQKLNFHKSQISIFYMYITADTVIPNTVIIEKNYKYCPTCGSLG